MKIEIAALGFMGAWSFFDRDDSMNAIDSAWYFKCTQTIPPMVQKLSNERMRFNYKQCKHRIFVIGDMSL